MNALESKEEGGGCLQDLVGGVVCVCVCGKLAGMLNITLT